MKQQKVWEGVFKEVREKLAKIEVSFSKEKTLKEDNIRAKDDKLEYFVIFLFDFFSFPFIFCFWT